MSLFSNIFGGKKGKAPTTGEAIQKLRETEDLLIKKQEFLEKKIETEIDTAKANAAKNKRVAIKALKRKKRFEKLLDQIDGTISTLEVQRETLEEANSNTAVMTVIKDAADALKIAHKQMNVDLLHDIMDEISEQQIVSQEITAALSNPELLGNDLDEDELLKELEDMQQELLEDDLLKVGPTNMPSVPHGEIIKHTPAATSKTENNDDMKELEAWAS